MKLLPAILLLLIAIPLRAEDAAIAPTTAMTAGGEKVTIPVPGRPTLVAFVRGGQPQSQMALSQIQAALGDGADLSLMVVVSGPNASEQAGAFVGRGTVLVDHDFGLSGRLNVRAWPTIVLIGPDGRERAHLAGVPKSLRADLSAHLDFLAGRIDADRLRARLERHEVVGDSAGDAAGRRLEVARRLMRSGEFDAARHEIDEALKLRPDDPSLRLALARVMLLQGDTAGAAGVLDAIPAGAVPPGQLQTLRGRAAILTGRWQEARALLEDAVKLNPSPAEAYYLLGIVHERAGDAGLAAAAFRRAFESEASRETMFDRSLLPAASP